MDDDQKPTGHRAARAIVIAAAVALAAVWLVPGAAADENRPPRDFPRLSRPGLMSASDFRAIDGALVDRLPAKGGVVSILGQAVIDVGLSPNSLVFRGPAGEPYLSQDFTNACLNQTGVAALDETSRDLQAVLGEHGIDFLWAIAPDKSAAMRDELGPAGDLLLTCSDANRQAMESFADDPGSPLLVGWKELSAAPDRVYFWGDSHWNPHGAAVFTELLIDRLGDDGIAKPGVFDPDDIVETETLYPNGGLYLYMGTFREEPTTMLASERAGVVTTHEVEGHDGVFTQRWVSTGPDLIPGRTLIVHDSFLFYQAGILAPYFADLTSVPVTALTTPGAIATIDGYDHVIIQQVQRIVPLYVEAIPAAAWITAGRPVVTQAPVP